MSREELIASANLLVAPSPEAATKYGRVNEQMALEMNRIMGDRPDVQYMTGGNIAMMEDNHRNHARFMESIFTLYNPAVFVDTVLWVFRAYRSHGFQLTYWPAQLDTWVEVLRRKLSPEAFREVYPFYNWMIINQPAFASLSDTILSVGEAVTGH